MGNKYVIHITRFVFLLFLQGIILDKIDFLAGRMLPFPYIYALLLLPFTTQRWVFLIVGFVYGFALDSFSNTLGMHTSATVFLAFITPYFRNFIAPVEGYSVAATPSVASQGLKWFLLYTSALTLLHHFWLFFIESFQWANFFGTVSKIFLSAVFSIGLILIFHLLSFQPKKSRK